MANGSEGMRRGSPVSFWGTMSTATPPVPTAVAVTAGTASNAVQVGRGTNMFTFFINSSGASTFTLQAAHVGQFTNQEIMPDPDDQTFVWYDLWYLGNSGSGNSTPITLAFTGAGTLASLVPDFEVDWVRLKRTDAGASVNVYAGHEAWGD